jgi:hypothetical protein
MVDEVLPQKIRDELSPRLIPSHLGLTPNLTLVQRGTARALITSRRHAFHLL